MSLWRKVITRLSNNLSPFNKPTELDSYKKIDKPTIEDTSGEAVRVLDDTPYVTKDAPDNPNGTFKVHGSPENIAIIGGADANVVKKATAEKCPLVDVGDIVEVESQTGYKTTIRKVKVMDLVYGEVGNSSIYAKCAAFDAIKSIHASDQEFYSPATEVPAIDCVECPVLRSQ